MVDLPPGEEIGDLRAAAPAAIAEAAGRMLEPEMGEYEGLPALRRLADEIGSWPDDAPDWQWCARFNYQVIERRGTGGGNFRPLYSRFLAEVGEEEGSTLAAAAAEEWSALAAALFEASESEEPEPWHWSEVAVAAERVLAGEERLWDALA